MQGQHLLQHQLDHVPVLGSGRVEQEVVVLGISATALERKAIYVFRLKMSSLAHLRPILHKHLLGCKLSENHLVVDVVLLPDDDDDDDDDNDDDVLLPDEVHCLLKAHAIPILLRSNGCHPLSSFLFLVVFCNASDEEG